MKAAARARVGSIFSILGYAFDSFPMFFLALDCDTFTGVRTILLSCLLLALLSNYTPYAEGGISPTAADQPIQEGEAAAEPDSQSIPEDPAITQLEAPEALFELDIGDAEVDFFLEGAWRASLLGSFGVLIGPDGTQLSPFPGFGQGLTFQQMPDLTFSVWLLNRFFIEASVIGDFLEHDYDYFDQNYILMGYLGEEGEFLKRILIGSKDVGIDPFPFVDVPEPGSSSLGVEAVMGTGMSEHQLLLRYDNNEPDSLTWYPNRRSPWMNTSADVSSSCRMMISMREPWRCIWRTRVVPTPMVTVGTTEKPRWMTLSWTGRTARCFSRRRQVGACWCTMK
jgi:hypothetical protein